jgi:hypothetical protein
MILKEAISAATTSLPIQKRDSRAAGVRDTLNPAQPDSAILSIRADGPESPIRATWYAQRLHSKISPRTIRNGRPRRRLIPRPKGHTIKRCGHRPLRRGIFRRRECGVILWRAVGAPRPATQEILRLMRVAVDCAPYGDCAYCQCTVDFRTVWGGFKTRPYNEVVRWFAGEHSSPLRKTMGKSLICRH